MMTLSVNASVEAAPNFLANLDESSAFFAFQDAGSADLRMKRLKAELREMVAVLSWSPGSGRPARFLKSRSAKVQLKTQLVQKLAEQANLPSLREYVLDCHLVLYAHSEKEVVLLALKHQLQLLYTVASMTP